MQRSFFGGPLLGPWMGRRRGEEPLARMPRLDVEDRADELVLSAELPGIDPEQVHVECRNDMLTIRGERREETAGEGEQYRSYTSFYRQLPVPPDVDVDRAQASFKHGLLRLRFPKTRGAANVKRIPVTAESREQPGKGRERAA